jgi:hypothetical protein
MDWKTAQTQTGGALNVPKRWLHLHYYEALNILFRTENALRVFVYVTLKNNHFDKWSDTAIQVSENEQSTISALANKRITQAQGFGYLGYEITSPLMHLNSGELVRLITSDTYWNLFKSYFKGKREIIRTKLDEVGTVRNSLAHFRPIKYDDIELIKQNVKHALIGVEECLSAMTRTYNVVPTNTKEDWYKSLKTLGTELCDIHIFQSKNEDWIRLQITFKAKILKKDQWWDEYISYTVLNLVSPAIIKSYKNIRKYVTYVTEFIPYAKIGEDLLPSFAKSVSFTFRKDVLASNEKEISADMKNMLLKIEQEVALVEQDNLARGELIETARTTAQIKESGDQKRWVPDSENLNCSFREDDPAEYWGDVGLYHSDFIAGTSKYPWMPSTISEKDGPFD